jgi:hypothetical protein
LLWKRQFSSRVGKVGLTGREADELYATIVESGVEPEGAAGSSFTSLSDIECTIDVHEIA